jgi:gamma-glutamyltranspeptidase/glutathione hydrolase
MLPAAGGRLSALYGSTMQVSTYTGSGAVAVTPHHLATEAALEVMKSGGNAADAVIAADAVLGMVLPTTCGIGGDLFSLVHRPGWDRPEVLNASGRGGAGLDAAKLRAAGHTVMPYRAPETITVRAVSMLVGLAAKRSAPLGASISPPQSRSATGFPVSKGFASSGDHRWWEPPRRALPGGNTAARGRSRRRDLAATWAIRSRAAKCSTRHRRRQIAAATGDVLTTDDLGNR